MVATALTGGGTFGFKCIGFIQSVVTVVELTGWFGIQSLDSCRRNDRSSRGKGLCQGIEVCNSFPVPNRVMCNEMCRHFITPRSGTVC